MAASDLVGEWTVKLSDGVHKIQFEHGTTTGKRIIRVDGKVNSFTGILFFVPAFISFWVTNCYHLANSI